MHGVDNVSTQNHAESNDDDEGEDDDDDGNLRIVFQTQDDEAFGVGNRDLEQGNLPVPGTVSNGQHDSTGRFLHPARYYESKTIRCNCDTTSQQQRRSHQRKPDNTVSPFFSVKTSAPKSSLLFSGSRKSPLKPQQTVKRKYNTGVSASTNAVKKRKTPLFFSTFFCNFKSEKPLRDRSKMRNSFLNMEKICKN